MCESIHSQNHTTHYERNRSTHYVRPFICIVKHSIRTAFEHFATGFSSETLSLRASNTKATKALKWFVKFFVNLWLGHHHQHRHHFAFLYLGVYCIYLPYACVCVFECVCVSMYYIYIWIKSIIEWKERKTEEKIESNQAKSNTNDSLLKLWIRIKLRSGFKQNKATYTTIQCIEYTLLSVLQGSARF